MTRTTIIPILLLFTLMTSLFSTTANAEIYTGQLPQTGQTTCYDAAGTAIACAGTGQDGDLLLGLTWPDPRFVSNSDQTVTDKLTGLIWSKDANPDGGTKTWQEGLDYIKTLNSQKYLGYSDWRLPNVNEIKSLVNQQQSNPATWLNGQGFSNVKVDYYWSSTTVAHSTSYAWIVNMNYGYTSFKVKTPISNYVWPVRGGQMGTLTLSTTGQTTCYNGSGATITCSGTGQDGELRTGAVWPSPRFVSYADQTVTDNLTSLVWSMSVNSVGGKSWQEALDYIKSINSSNYLGYSDWRLPNRNELESLVNRGQLSSETWLNGQGFSNVQANYCWSSTTNASGTSGAWIVGVGTGETFYFNKTKTYDVYVWPVRGGQWDPFDTLLVGKNTLAKYIVLGKQSQAEMLIVNRGEPDENFSAKMTGSNSAEFSFAPGGSAPCTSLNPTLASAASCTLLVTVNPVSTGYKSANLTITANSASKDIAISTTAYSTILGTITDISTGLPVSGATVTLDTNATATTDAAGAYNFGTAIPSGTYKITSVTKTGYQSVSAANLVVNNTQSATANILLPTPGTFNITSTQLPSATAGTAYNSRVMLSGGTYPYTFSKVYGNLPTGLSLDTTTGTISGTPTGSGSYTFGIGATDNVSAYSEVEFTIDITGTLAITTTSLSRATVNSSYPATITATGGKTAYSYSMTSGALPAGLTLTITGTFSGKPTTSGDFPITITVTDSTGRTASQNLTFSVDQPLTITTTKLDVAKQGVAYTLTPTITGGYSTKTWSLYSGVLPAGVTLSTTTGTISGTPTEVASRVITLLVTDAVGRTDFKSYPMTVTVPLGFSSSKFPNAPLNAAYSERAQVIGGIAPYTITTSDTPPAGLTFNNGQLSGTATQAVVKSLGLTVTDSSYPTPQTFAQTFSIRVTSLLTPTTGATLPTAKKGVAITAVNFAATGGSAPYSWSHIGGTLPTGVTFNPTTATLSGTPTDIGDFSFTLHLADSVGNQTGDSINPDKVFNLHVSDTLTVTTTSLPTAALNIPYSTTLTSNGGFQPITWKVSTGTLPTGITLDVTTGQLSGTPTGSTATVTFMATDSDATKQTATQQLTITVSSTLTIIETTLPDAKTSSGYSANIRAQFGTAPYSWRISAGTLPAGLNLASTATNATISGAPTAIGAATFTVEVADSSATAQKVTRQFTITIQGALSNNSATLPPITTGQPYTANINVSGGATPYSFTVTAGTLPQGIYLNSASGVISGTTSTTGGSTFTITVTDSGVPAQSVSQTYTLTALVSVPITKSTASAGNISSNPAGITCDTTCTSTSGSFAAGSSVVITATPATGYYLSSWSGCDSSSGNSCSITARDGLSPITASFSRQMATGLTMGPPVTSIKTNATVTLSGVLGTIPAGNGDHLSGKTISITLTKPDGTAITPAYTAITTGTSGSWSLQIPAIFTAPGTYLASATFTGSTELIATTSSTSTILMDKSAGYAIVVTGKSTNNYLLDLHTTSTDAIVATLKKRGFLDTNINYLKSTTNSTVTKTQIQAAIANWAKDKLAASAAPLYLIMIDHGSSSGFVLGDETLTPNDLKGWFDTLEADTSITSAVNSYKRFIIIGSCYSGQFVVPLSKTGRVIITSAGETEESIAGVKMWDINSSSYLTGGEYFIDSLFTFLGRGDNFKNAFISASGSLPARDARRITNGYHYGVWDTLAQHPLLDDNGDGSGSYQLTGSDSLIAATLKLGEGITTNAGDNPADIKTVTPQTSLDSSSTSTTLWLQANMDARVGSAWVEIRTPDTTATGAGTGGQVIINLTTQTLTHNSTTGRWETIWNGFTKEGRYDIFYYTTDIQTGEQSPPVQSTAYKNKVSNTAPTTFDLLTPAGESTVNQEFSASWQESSDSDGLTYTLQIAADQNFSNIFYIEQDIPQGFTVIPDTALKNPAQSNAYICENGDNYCWWRIKAIDSYGAMTSSTSARSFTIVRTNGLPGTIKGYLKSSSGVPISGAIVAIGTVSTTTQSNGAFIITVPTGSHTVTATATGYQQKSVMVTAIAGKTVSSDVSLLPNATIKQDSSITVTTSAPPTAAYNTQFTVAATSSSGLAVTYSSGTPTICTNSGATFTMIAGSGTCTVQYDQGGNNDFNATPQKTDSTTANKAGQTIGAISFNPTTLTAGGTTSASATATSGLSVTFTSITPAVCSVSGTTVNGITSGICTVAANQPGDSTYAAASDVQKTITVANASYTVTGSTSGNGSIQCITPVISGNTTTCTLTPDTGFRISAASGCSTGNLTGTIYTTGTITASCTVTASFAVQKAGDCDNSGTVTIAEVQSAINMFLGLKAVDICVDLDNSNGVSIAEVQKVINSFLGL